MATPPFRKHDINPYRADDVRVKAFGVEMEASGRIVVALMVALAALLVAAWGIIQNEAKHDAMLHAFEVQICVLTLNEDERRVFRTEGKYCPTPLIRFTAAPPREPGMLARLVRATLR